MKTFYIYAIIGSFAWVSFFDSPSNYESKLSDIASKFHEKIWNEDECKHLMYEASDIADEIDDELKKEDYTPTEVSNFKEVKKKALAMEAYIGMVSGCSNTIPTNEEFNLANSLVRGNVSNIVKGKFCIDFISLTIKEFKVYIGKNNSDTNYTVSYRWKSPDGQHSGNGTMGLSEKSVRQICNNRARPNENTITIYGVTCKPF